MVGEAMKRVEEKEERCCVSYFVSFGVGIDLEKKKVMVMVLDKFWMLGFVGLVG